MKPEYINSIDILEAIDCYLEITSHLLEKPKDLKKKIKKVKKMRKDIENGELFHYLDEGVDIHDFI